MLARTAIVIAAMVASAAAAQPQAGISGLNTPGPGTGDFVQSARLGPTGADPKEWKQRRLDRLKTILAANPGAVEALQTMNTPRERAAYIRTLDRKTPY